MENLPIVELYTDGACSQNGTWVGGYGAILLYNGHKKEISGYQENTTNNQMELRAVIEGLKALKTKVRVTIYTDSAYVHNAFTQGWIASWQANSWRNSQKKEVSNKEMWLELINECNKHEVTWQKVKGHADNEYNNACDKLATNAIKKFEDEKKG